MQPALLGGLFIGVLSGLPIVQLCNCCCVWLLGGGVLTAYLEQQNQSGPISVAQGARAGAIAGVVGAVVWLIVTLAMDVVLAPLQERMVAEVLRSASDIPPEVRGWLENTDRTAGHVFSFFLMLVCGSVAAAIGGAGGASYFRKDVPPALGGPMMPPPLP